MRETVGLVALVEAVETGDPRRRIGGGDRMTLCARALCPYPEVTRYEGTGSIDEAESFECRQPD